MDARSKLSAVLSQLEGFAPSLAEEYTSYVIRVLGRIRVALAQLDAIGFNTAQVIGTHLEALSSPILWRVLTSPELGDRLHNLRQPERLLDFLGDAIFVAENPDRCDQHSGELVRLAALGDVVISEKSWASRTPYLFGSIPLDGFSVYARSTLCPGLGDAMAFDPLEWNASVANFDAAGKFLSQTPNVAQFVRTFVRHVILRKGDDHPGVKSSISMDRYIGRVVIVNPHQRNWTEHALADALVHEATHSLLYTLEDEGGGPWCPPSNDRIGSPVTGSQLDPHSFIHATLVYYVLHSYWSRCETPIAFRNERLAECEQFIEFACAPSTIDHLARASANRDVVDILANLWHRLKKKSLEAAV